MPRMKHSLLAIITTTLVSAAALSQTPDEAARGTLVQLTAEAQQGVANDLGLARAYVEMSDVSTAELARRVNRRIADMLTAARAYPTVKTRSSGVQTYPVYGKSGERIESWRMRSELELESTDLPALAELVGRLQSVAAVGQLTMMPAPTTMQRAVDAATVAAIRAFRARAELVAQTLGKPWRLRTLNLGTAPGPGPIFPASFAKGMAAAAPAPIEAGESQVSVSASGSIELIDGAP